MMSKRVRCPCEVCAPLWVEQDAVMPPLDKIVVYVIMTVIPVIGFIFSVVMTILGY